MYKHVTVESLRKMLKEPDAKTATVAEIHRRHLELFGEAGKDKSISNKLNDLQTYQILDKIEQHSYVKKLRETMENNRDIVNYWDHSNLFMTQFAGISGEETIFPLDVIKSKITDYLSNMNIVYRAVRKKLTACWQKRLDDELHLKLKLLVNSMYTHSDSDLHVMTSEQKEHAIRESKRIFHYDPRGRVTTEDKQYRTAQIRNNNMSYLVTKIPSDAHAISVIPTETKPMQPGDPKKPKGPTIGKKDIKINFKDFVTRISRPTEENLRYWSSDLTEPPEPLKIRNSPRAGPDFSALSKALAKYDIIDSKELKLLNDLSRNIKSRYLALRPLDRFSNRAGLVDEVPRCKYYQVKEDLSPGKENLIGLLHSMELSCATQARGITQFLENRAVISHRVNLPTLPEDYSDINYFNYIMSQIPEIDYKLYNLQLSFRIADQQGIDEGGVGRMVLDWLVNHIKSRLISKNGYYWFDSAIPLQDKDIDNIAHVFILSVQLQQPINIPMSHGFYGNLTHVKSTVAPLTTTTPRLLMVKDIHPFDIEIGELMHYYRLDDSVAMDQLMEVIALEDHDEYVEMHPQTSELKSAPLNYTQRIVWFKEVLIKKLFYDTGNVVVLENYMKFKKIFNNLSVPYRIRSDVVKGQFNAELTREIANNIKIHNENGALTLVPMMRRYIDDNDLETVRELLTFIHGIVDYKRPIKIQAHGGIGYPVAHTCFGTLDMRVYEDYETFAKELTYAIKNTAGMHLA